tara:strand:+ start:539 stop:850 length:312 start_codon:yes stop_codon:yes gene_type:complete
VLYDVQVTGVESRFSPRQGEVETVEAVISCLTFNFIHCMQAELGRPMIFAVASGIGPTVATFVVAESSEQPTNSKDVTIKQSPLPHTDDIVERYFRKVIVTPF